MANDIQAHTNGSCRTVQNTLPKQYCEFVEVANEQGFQMALFKIPAGQQIPLHDHPGVSELEDELLPRHRTYTACS
eukprot:747159-Rhodomonas_salina.2